MMLAPLAVQQLQVQIVALEQSAGFPVYYQPVMLATQDEVDAATQTAPGSSAAYETLAGPVLAASDVGTVYLALDLAHEALHEIHAHGSYETDDPRQQALEEDVTQANAVNIWHIFYAARRRGAPRALLSSYGNAAGVHYACHLAESATGSRSCAAHAARAWLRAMQQAGAADRDAMIAEAGA